MKVMQRMLPPLLALAWAQSALGVSVINGDFGTGDFTGWMLDTDGAASSGSDFSVVNTPGGRQARIDVDYWRSPGDIASAPVSEALVYNALFQELDTALAPGNLIRLSFDWLFTGEDGANDTGDIFSVGLNDGTGDLYGADGLLGFLISPTNLYGSGNVDTLLDSGRFANAGWLLEFQLLIGSDAGGSPNGLGSSLYIANVQVAEFTPTPVPGPLSLLSLALPILRYWRSGSAADAAEPTHPLAA